MEEPILSPIREPTSDKIPPPEGTSNPDKTSAVAQKAIESTPHMPDQSHVFKIRLIAQQLELEDKIAVLEKFILEGDSSKSAQLIEAQQEMARLKEQQILHNIDYTNEFDGFIKKQLSLLKHHPSLPEGALEIPLYKQIVAYGLKGSFHKETRVLNQIYIGFYAQYRSYINAKATHTLTAQSMEHSLPGLTTQEERRGLERIHRHNMQFLTIENMFPPQEKGFSNNEAGRAQKKTIEDYILKNIDELDKENPSPDLVVILEDGSRFFAIPGGWDYHYVNYGFKKNTDGSYEFIMFNRGNQPSDVNLTERLHGSIAKKIGKKKYMRGRVQIKVPNIDLLKNRDLISLLVEGRATVYKKYEVSAGQVYRKICDTLLGPGKGKVIVSKQEKMVDMLIQYMNRNPELDHSETVLLINALIKSDPNFSSTQTYGTCGVSNSTGIYEMLAPKKTIKAIKKYTIEEIRNAIVENYMINRETTTKNVLDCGSKLDSLVLSRIGIKVDIYNSIINYQEVSKLLTEAQEAFPGAEISKLKEDRQSMARDALALCKSLQNDANNMDDNDKKSLCLTCLKDIEKAIEIALTTENEHEIVDGAFDVLFENVNENMLKNLNTLDSLYSKMGKNYESVKSLTLLAKNNIESLEVGKNINEANIFKKFEELQFRLKNQSDLQPLLEELSYHLEKEFGHSRIFLKHTGERIQSLHDKLAAPTKIPASDPLELAKKFLNDKLKEEFRKNRIER